MVHVASDIDGVSSTGSQGIPLLALPHDVLSRIATTAGPASRQLCKPLEAAFGPLRSLQPDGLLTPDQLHAALAALASRHAPSLQSLDLRHVGRLLTHARLSSLLPAFPALRHLCIHHCPHLWTPSLATIATATTLTALELRACAGLEASTWSTLTQLTALRSLTLELDACPSSPPPTPQATTGHNRTARRATDPSSSAAASQPPATASSSRSTHRSNGGNGCSSTSAGNNVAPPAAPPAPHQPPPANAAAGRATTSTLPTPSLPPTTPDAPPTFAPLTALTRLTHLHLASAKELPESAALSLLSATARLPRLHTLVLDGHVCVPGGATSARLLALHTHLRSLHLTVFDLDDDGPRKAGALLTALHSLGPQLTGLHLRLEHDYVGVATMGTLATDVSACLAHLPHLQSLGLLVRWAQLPMESVVHSTSVTSLRLAFWGEGYRPQELAQLHMQLGGCLRSLHLEQGAFCTASLEQLVGLTGLTHLSLQSAARLPLQAAAGAASARLGALVNLRALHLQGGVARWALDTPQLVGLTGLTALSLLVCMVKDPELEQLAGLTALRTLDLGATWGLQGVALERVRQLPDLRDLGLPLPADLQHGPEFLGKLVPPPPGLRRVRLGRHGGPLLGAPEQLGACVGVLEQYCEVILQYGWNVFRDLHC